MANTDIVDDTLDDIKNAAGVDLKKGYHVLEVIDEKTKEITFDILHDGRLAFSTITKPLAFAFIAGHKANVENAKLKHEGEGEGKERKGEREGEGKGEPSEHSTPNPGSQSGSKSANADKPAAPNRSRRML